MAIGNLERDASRLFEVQAALRQIDGGMFGICVDCEANLNPRRLAAGLHSVSSARRLQRLETFRLRT